MQKEASKMRYKLRSIIFLSAIFALSSFVYLRVDHSNSKGWRVPWLPEAHAAGGKVTSPTGTAPDRYEVSCSFKQDAYTHLDD